MSKSNRWTTATPAQVTALDVETYVIEAYVEIGIWREAHFQEGRCVMDHSPFPVTPHGDDEQRGLPPRRDRGPDPEREPGHEALEALSGAESDALIAVMLRSSFKPIAAHDLVAVAPCHHCGDGGLRTAGSVKTRTGREPVRACDTCHTVEIGPLGRAQVVRLPETNRWM